MAHLRPPSGITTLKALRDSLAAVEPVQVAAPTEAPSQEIELVQSAAAIPDPGPIQEAAPIQVQEATTIEFAPAVQDAAPIQDARSGIPDAGSRIRDKRLGIRDPRLGALASWARAERPGRGAAAETDDLRALLTGLAVPSAVVAVGYGRGCRIRRVRVLRRASRGMPAPPARSSSRNGRWPSSGSNASSRWPPWPDGTRIAPRSEPRLPRARNANKFDRGSRNLR